MSSGEPLNPAVIDQVRRAWGLSLRDSYGQTETTMMVANSPGQKVIAGSMGRPLPGYRIVLLDADGLVSDHGEIALPLRPAPGRPHERLPSNDTGEPTPMDGAYYRTGDVADPRRGGLHHLCRPRRRRLQIERLSHEPVRARKRAHRARGGGRGRGRAGPRSRCATRRPRPISCSPPGFEPNAETAASIFAHIRDAALALQARAADRVRRAAQDGVGQDPPGRAARPRERRSPKRASVRRTSSGSRIFRRGIRLPDRRPRAVRLRPSCRVPPRTQSLAGRRRGTLFRHPRAPQSAVFSAGRVLTRSLGPSSIPSLGDGVMLGTAWIDRPVDTQGCAPCFHVLLSAAWKCGHAQANDRHSSRVFAMPPRGFARTTRNG